MAKTENLARKKKGRREYLNNEQIRDLMRKLGLFLESKIEISRMKVGKRQTVETLINEKVLLLAKFLRDENLEWIPRIGLT